MRRLRHPEILHFADAHGFDLELTDHRTLDGRIQELAYRPALHP